MYPIFLVRWLVIDSEHVTWCGVSRVWRGLPLVGEMSRDPQLASDWLRTAVTREVTITWAEECMNCVGRSVTPTTPGTLCHFRHPAQWPAEQWPDQIQPDSGSRGRSWCSWCYRPRHRPSSLVTRTNNLIIHTTTTLATLSTSEDDNSKLMQYILYLHFFTAPMCASLVLKYYTTRLFFYQENCPNNK